LWFLKLFFCSLNIICIESNIRVVKWRLTYTQQFYCSWWGKVGTRYHHSLRRLTSSPLFFTPTFSDSPFSSFSFSFFSLFFLRALSTQLSLYRFHYLDGFVYAHIYMMGSMSKEVIFVGLHAHIIRKHWSDLTPSKA